MTITSRAKSDQLGYGRAYPGPKRNCVAMATSGNDHRPLGRPGSRRGPAHASIWSPRGWRDHRFVAAAVITMAVTATVSGATVAARPATSEAIAASSGSFGSVASDPSGPPSMSASGDPTSPFRSPARSPITFPNQSFPNQSFPNQRVGPSVGTTDPAVVLALAAGGIPATALNAYRRAAAAANPACGITWPLLAGIGRVESNHGRFAGAVLHSDGLSTPPVIGIRLDGSRSVVIRDTDGGRRTATVPTTTRSGRCSSSHRRGRPTAPTATATADTTRSTSMTRPPPPRATSARPAEICVQLSVSSGRSGPTTRQRVMCPRCSLSRPHTPRVQASWFRYRQP